MKVIFLDLETTGLNPDLHGIWQVAVAEAFQDGGSLNLNRVVEEVFRPMEKEKVRKFLAPFLENSALMVAHNASFERKFLEACGVVTLPRSFCTMLETTDLCKIPIYRWDYWEQEEVFVGYKWPKLSEAVEILVKDRYSELLQLADGDYHDAVYDLLDVVRLYVVVENLSLDWSRVEVRKVSRLRKWLYRRKYYVF